MGLALVTAPSGEPITLDEAKEHLRIEPSVSDEDNLITSLIAASRSFSEQYTGRAFVSQTWRLDLDRFPGAGTDSFDYEWGRQGRILLPKSPLSSVDEITYIDTNGAAQTLSTAQYRVNISAFVGQVEPAYGYVWPVTLPTSNAVSIEFTAGYGTIDDVPQDIKQAILFLVAHLFENREAMTYGQISHVPFTFEALLSPYRVVSFE